MIKLFYVYILMFLFFAKAETYLDIMPSDNLGIIKAKFPNAKFEKLNPAWAKENEALYQFQGSGLSGTIILKLNSDKSLYLSEARVMDSILIADSLDQPDTSLWSDLMKRKRSLVYSNSMSFWNSYNNYTDDSMIVDWVRWVPTNDIPVERFIMKYGKPDTTNFTEDDLTPYKYWKRGIRAFYDENKVVIRVDFAFTYLDYKLEYFKKNGVNKLPIEYDNYLRKMFNMPLLKDKK